MCSRNDILTSIKIAFFCFTNNYQSFYCVSWFFFSFFVHASPEVLPNLYGWFPPSSSTRIIRKDSGTPKNPGLFQRANRRAHITITDLDSARENFPYLGNHHLPPRVSALEIKMFFLCSIDFFFFSFGFGSPYSFAPGKKIFFFF